MQLREEEDQCQAATQACHYKQPHINEITMSHCYVNSVLAADSRSAVAAYSECLKHDVPVLWRKGFQQSF
jgi:hypothetical protein